jgi:hypothetical protein
MPYCSLASMTKLMLCDALLFIPIGISAYLFYSVWPCSLVLQNYYHSFFLPLLLFLQAVFSFVVFIGVKYAYYGMHGISFFSLSVGDQVVFFTAFSALIGTLLAVMIPIVSGVTVGTHAVSVSAVDGPYQKAFDACCVKLKEMGIELFLEAPEKRLIIGQFVVEIDFDNKQTCLIELVFLKRVTLFGKLYLHVICYSASKKVYIEQLCLKQMVNGVVTQLKAKNREKLLS